MCMFQRPFNVQTVSPSLTDFMRSGSRPTGTGDSLYWYGDRLRGSASLVLSWTKHHISSKLLLQGLRHARDSHNTGWLPSSLRIPRRSRDMDADLAKNAR